MLVSNKRQNLNQAAAPRCSQKRATGSRPAFTLIELMLVISAVAVLTALGVKLLAEVQQDAMHDRTEAQIVRLQQILDSKLEESWYRILPMRYTIRNDGMPAEPIDVATVHAAAMEELLRVEFPTQQADLLNPFPVNSATSQYDWTNFPAPQMLLRYRSKMSSEGPWSIEHESSECLFAILSLHYLDDGTAAISQIRENQIGDTDDDDYMEILDAFGDPLQVDLVDNTGNHVDPNYTLPGNPPANAQDYRFIITSPNTTGKLR